MGLARSSFLKQNFRAAAEFAHSNYEVTSTFNRGNLADTAEAAMAWARYRAEAGETAEAMAQIHAAMPENPQDLNVWIDAGPLLAGRC
jgi:hypothetical protein